MDHLTEADKKYIVDKPERGFSPARNHDIIESVIEHYEAERARREKIYQDKVGERIDMATSYLKRRVGGLEMRVEEYLGQSNLKKAWGENFAEKIQIASELYKRKGIAPKILL